MYFENSDKLSEESVVIDESQSTYFSDTFSPGETKQQLRLGQEVIGEVSGMNVASGSFSITATGLLSITGLTFTPKEIEIYAYLSATDQWSRGNATKTTLQNVLWYGTILSVFYLRNYSGTSIILVRNNTAFTTASLSSFDAGGFTLNVANYLGTETLCNYIVRG